MNSIRRPRRRPRVRSVNFRTFGWVLLREAALRVCYPGAPGWPGERHARLYCSSKDSAAVRGLAEKMLEYHPERRYWPPR